MFGLSGPAMAAGGWIVPGDGLARARERASGVRLGRLLAAPLAALGALALGVAALVYLHRTGAPLSVQRHLFQALRGFFAVSALAGTGTVARFLRVSGVAARALRAALLFGVASALPMCVMLAAAPAVGVRRALAALRGGQGA